MTDFSFGFVQNDVKVQENEILELSIGVLVGSGTEIPFDIKYFTTDGNALGRPF